MLKQTPGWTVPRLRSPEAAGRWMWLVTAAHTRLRSARPVAMSARGRPVAPVRPDPGCGSRASTGIDEPGPGTAP
ncbi:hypothetical protein GCM10023224_17110 [Streptomonospora halophila]|uniref:Type II toxin-antitoxin system prevent-host-death family antitoxin n=1 Tax=Streptomonospora halophila TaxID=427369 RepID=A0ABP9GD90_9ACTN